MACLDCWHSTSVRHPCFLWTMVWPLPRTAWSHGFNAATLQKTPRPANVYNIPSKGYRKTYVRNYKPSLQWIKHWKISLISCHPWPICIIKPPMPTSLPPPPCINTIHLLPLPLPTPPRRLQHYLHPSTPGRGTRPTLVIRLTMWIFDWNEKSTFFCFEKRNTPHLTTPDQTWAEPKKWVAGFPYLLLFCLPSLLACHLLVYIYQNPMMLLSTLFSPLLLWFVHLLQHLGIYKKK